ncbi:MAG: prolyl oligopeptidase family serine peptidase [Serratia symbiotica]|nr:prolyl oligopeptidase family serine peptidase [Serratia symbiotica]
MAQVPFVDVVTTMLDESIPLTTGEYDQWGNPNEQEYYDYIKHYSARNPYRYTAAVGDCQFLARAALPPTWPVPNIVLANRAGRL